MRMGLLAIKIRWVILAIGAIAMTILAIIYGKRTPAVIKTQILESRAREKALQLELDAAQAGIKQADGERQAHEAEVRATELESQIHSLQARRERLILSGGFLSDDAVAAADNARARAHG